jgi:D-sedoheptulose 7-phosphate isomerase
MSRLEDLYEDHLRVFEALRGLAPDVEAVAHVLAERLRGGGKVVWFGNGGSAADSQHLAAELVGRFRLERPAYASIALTTDTSLLTAVGNDYGFDRIFARQVEGLCTERDVVVGLSTSGRSPNVRQALEAARTIGAFRVGLTGTAGAGLAELCDRCLVVPSRDTARIQEAHIFIGHALCDLVEQALVRGTPDAAS